MKKAIITLGALTGAVGAAAFYGFHEWAYRALIHADFKVPESLGKAISENKASDASSLAAVGKEWMHNHGYQKYNMLNADGNMLTAYLFRPKKKSNVYVFASHGYRSEGIGEWCFFAKYYVEELGYNLFVVDHQGQGKSTGQYLGFGSLEARDGIQWLKFMNDKFGKKIKIFLHGISMGSATVMLMTGDKDLPENVRFTIADCGYTSALNEFNYKLQALNIPTWPLVPCLSRKNIKRAKYDFQKDTDALSAVGRAKIPMLFIHGTKDKFVPTYMVHELFDNCSSPYKDKFIVEGADHAESYRVDKQGYEKKINEFAKMFLK